MKTTRICLVAALIAAGVLPALSFDAMDITRDWRCQPAAAAVARATFADFLADTSTALAAAYTDGETAARLAQCLGLDAEPWNGARLENAVLLLGDDSTHTFASLDAALGANAHALVIDSERLVAEAGIGLYMPQATTVSWTQQKKQYLDPAAMKRPEVALGELDGIGTRMIGLEEEQPALEFKPKNMREREIPRTWTCVTNTGDAAYYRTRDTAAFGKFPFRGVGPQHLRWREGMSVKRMRPKAGWTVAGDGVFAVSDDGRIVIDMLKPFLLTDQRKERKDTTGLRNAALSQDNQMRRYSLVLQNWGVRPAASQLARALTIVPLPEKGGKAPGVTSLYWSENPDYDPYWFCYW